MAHLPIDCWLNIVCYLDLNDILTLAKFYPEIQEIFYYKCVVRDIWIRELTEDVTSYILNFPEDHKHLVETLDISYIEIKPRSLLEKFIVSLTGLTAFWALQTMHMSTYKLIIKKIGDQLHTLGTNIVQEESYRSLENLKNLFIGDNYICRALINVTEFFPTVLCLDMIFRLARNVEYLWVEQCVKMDCSIQDFVNFKEFMFINADNRFNYHKARDIQTSEIIQKFGFSHLRSSGFHKKYVNIKHDTSQHNPQTSRRLDLNNLIGFAGSTCLYQTPKNAEKASTLQESPEKRSFKELIYQIANTCKIFELASCDGCSLETNQPQLDSLYQISLLRNLQSLTLENLILFNLDFLAKIIDNCQQLHTLRLTTQSHDQHMFEKVVPIISKSRTLKSFRYSQVLPKYDFNTFLASLILLPHLERMAFCVPLTNIPFQRVKFKRKVIPNFPPNLIFLALEGVDDRAERSLFAILKRYAENRNFSYYVAGSMDKHRGISHHDYWEMLKMRTNVADLDNCIEILES